MKLRLAILSFCLVCTGVAHAQDARAPRARELFEQGMAALSDDRASEAIGLFRRSLALSSRVPTAYNLALALRETSQFVEADRLLGQLLAGEFGELDELTHNHVVAHRAELSPRIATLVVSSTREVEVEIDDRSVGRASRGAPLERPMDPGPHVVRGIHTDGTSVERSISLAEGERASLVLPVRIEEGPAPVPVTAPSSTVDAGLVVLLTSIGALVVAGAVIAIVIAVTPGREEDPIWGNTMAISF
jgi:hypothetical protein